MKNRSWRSEHVGSLTCLDVRSALRYPKIRLWSLEQTNISSSFITDMKDYFSLSFENKTNSHFYHPPLFIHELWNIKYAPSSTFIYQMNFQSATCGDEGSRASVICADVTHSELHVWMFQQQKQKHAHRYKLHQQITTLPQSLEKSSLNITWINQIFNLWSLRTMF